MFGNVSPGSYYVEHIVHVDLALKHAPESRAR